MDNFSINLQLFSEERTEKATPKKREDARKKGQVAKSRELISAIILLASFICLKLYAGFVYNELYLISQKLLSYTANLDEAFKAENLMNTFVDTSIVLVKVVGPILAVIGLAALLSNYLQVGFIFTTKPLEPRFDKLNPINGFKRLFSKQALAELIKSILKILVLGFIIYDYLKKNYRIIPELMGMSVEQTALFIGGNIINIGMRSAFTLLVLAIFDYGFQIWEYEKNLRMSKQELKEEYKQIEGNPQVKSKIKEKQRQMALRRMMSEVPKADVIITNPTHYAVAIKYDTNINDAPLVIAKGKDLIANRIKEVAKENGISIIENKPLAQALYKNVEIGSPIPVELYKAVAEVLAFVYNLRNK